MAAAFAELVDQNGDGGKPKRVPPEVQAALNDAVGKAIAEKLAAFAPQIGAAKAGEVVDGGTVDSSAIDPLFRQMAAAFAELVDQNGDGGKPKRIPPEVQARRDSARDRMFASLERMRSNIKKLAETGQKGAARAATPRYRALTKLYLNERMIEPFRMDPSTRQPVPVEFFWTGPPNQAMRPINEAALEIFGHYRDWIGGVDTGAVKKGWVSPKGVVVLIGETSRPPITQMQRNGFQPDFGDAEVSESLYDEPSAEKAPFGDDLAIVNEYGAHGIADPRASTINVLGTIHPAAVQAQVNDVVRRGT
jgi:hypothetical protein